MHRRLIVLLVTVAAALAATALPAQAAPPHREPTVTFDPDVLMEDEYYTQVCGFPVQSRVKGHFRFTLFKDRSGNITREMAHPSFRSTLISPYGSLTTADRGMDRGTLNPDGTFTVFGTGIHLKVKGGAHAIGLWVLTFDRTGELVSEEYHGRFDVTAPEIDAYVCDALGPSAP